MKFEIIKTSTGYDTSYVKEFKTIKELYKWVKEINENVIIRTDGMLEIYDSYRE